MASETFDASAGWMAGMDRKIRKQEEVEELIRFWLCENPHDASHTDEEISQEASNLLERLAKIDRS